MKPAPFFAALALALPVWAFAGQSCEEKPLTPETFRLAMQTAQTVQQRLDALDSDVVVLGRMGQDLSKYNLRYTHAGIVYRTAPDRRWRVAHLLNDCGTDRSDLWYEGLGNFFLDDMFRFDSVALVPPPQVAKRLLERLNQPARLRELHTARYNLLAYPFSTRYENSNVWVLEQLAAAESREAMVRSREQAQMWLKLNGYQPTELNLGPMTRLGGRMFKANVAFDDHPSELRYADRIQTVSVDSIIHFFDAREEGWKVEEIAGAQPRRY
ncbi:DUF2145 domain-containing protein [Chromobacterium phragmitis]|uniref:DUF2145 domain-containing protein n=1 Tax=Chromobacterium phragmitis TaxID=2202141 RepID=A0A344UJG9_9NEIS|nr:DUF2145 domain-containing protein [Chromobacterium phragmitis]AXE35417.1 DUF2145 domain-containing protein [Chromobacterium phragmitis]